MGGRGFEAQAVVLNVAAGPANLTQAAREKLWGALREHAQANLNKRPAAQLAAVRHAPGATLRAIVDQLNWSGYRPRYGKAFHPVGVQRLLPKAC